MARQGKRYSALDLASLTGDGLSWLVWLNVQLAIRNLAMARQIPDEEARRSVPGLALAASYLEQLQLGNRVFDVELAAQAGLPALQKQRSLVVCGATRYFGDVYEEPPCCPPLWPDTPTGCC